MFYDMAWLTYAATLGGYIGGALMMAPENRQLIAELTKPVPETSRFKSRARGHLDLQLSALTCTTLAQCQKFRVRRSSTREAP